MKPSFPVSAAVAAIVLFPAVLRAASVSVPNHGFEDYSGIGDGTTGSGWASFPGSAGGSIATALTINDEFWSNPSSFASGWQSNGPQLANGQYGLQHPSFAQQPHEGDASLSSPMEGYFIGFMNLSTGNGAGHHMGSVQSGALGQLAAGTYTLTIAIGARAATWNDLTYSISLVSGGLIAGTGSSGGTVLGTAASMTVVPTTLVAGATMQDLTYQFSLAEGDGLIGSDYAVRIDIENLGTRDGVASPNGTGDFTQANFDNVRLDFAAVPEPATLLLFLCGAGGLFRRRR